MNKQLVFKFKSKEQRRAELEMRKMKELDNLLKTDYRLKYMSEKQKNEFIGRVTNLHKRYKVLIEGIR